ncbi:peptidylprolyl isomerase [Neisseria perflava]|uniref:peptidylprolyl isomerase n=1 Tax=Neisseria perflava TaxID=33053 RepID=UPI00209DBDFA|nr:peptidyl-prolyl cis-trans isomerase [Neisseria perflava]MCP1659932.1 peptidyl-prolyl cis-trans isomerase C [Neisseria perflava]MCP1772220.1 peptidyl-prolyl cis-trans isomerase C [Neisseria perflava]
MKKTHIASALMLAALSGSLFAQTLVTVNGQAIDSSVIDAQVKAVRDANSQVKDSPALRQSLTERQVVTTVVGQEAKRLKLDQSDAYKQALAQNREQAKKSGADKKPDFKTTWAAFEGDLLAQAYAIHIAQQNPVQEKDVKTAYDNFSKFYKGTQEVQLGEIVTRSKADADKAIADLRAKKSFASVLKQYSIDEQAKQAGGIPSSYVPLKDLQQANSPLYPAVKDLKKGGFTATPLQNGDYYGVFYVNDRRDVKVPAYDDVKNQIGNDLQAARVDAAIQSLLEKANIKPAK